MACWSTCLILTIKRGQHIWEYYPAVSNAILRKPANIFARSFTLSLLYSKDYVSKISTITKRKGIDSVGIEKFLAWGVTVVVEAVLVL